VSRVACRSTQLANSPQYQLWQVRFYPALLPTHFIFSADFVAEIWGTFKFYFDYARNKPGTRAASSGFDDRRYHPGIAGPGRKADFGEAFGFNRHRGGALPQPVPASPNSYDENIRLTPYATHRRQMSDPEAKAL
jgi:hypothetical protein